MDTPAKLFEARAPDDAISACFGRTFVPVKGIRFLDKRPILYAGSGVLQNFYQDPEWPVEEVFVYVPVMDWSLVDVHVRSTHLRMIGHKC